MSGRYLDITLIKIEKVVNAYGDWVEQEVRRKVYAEERSVSQNEFFQAAAVGYKPEVKFILENWQDYRGEQIVEYVPFMWDPNKPIRLNVLRTYNAGDTLELTCYRGVDRNVSS